MPMSDLEDNENVYCNEDDGNENDEYFQDTPPDVIEEANNAKIGLLPEVSKNRYEYVFSIFSKWKESRKISTESFSELTLLAYFQYLYNSKKAPSTLWSYYLMLRTTTLLKTGTNIAIYHVLQLFLKSKSKGYEKKKARTLKPEDIDRFMTEAPEKEYYVHKVALIFGITGATRTDELKKLSITDIEEQGSVLLVNLPAKITKTRKKKSFIIQDQEHLRIALKYRNF